MDNLAGENSKNIRGISSYVLNYPWCIKNYLMDVIAWIFGYNVSRTGIKPQTTFIVTVALILKHEGQPKE